MLYHRAFAGNNSRLIGDEMRTYTNPAVCTCAVSLLASPDKIKSTFHVERIAYVLHETQERRADPRHRRDRSMAIFHMHVKNLSRAKGAGRTAPGAAAYRAGEKIYDVATGLTHDYTRKSGIVHAEIVLPAGAPDRLRDRATLWNEVEASEKRVNSRVAREVEIALPTELSTDQQIELVREYAAIFAADGMCADVCIHHKHDENPHAHILLTTREIDPKTGEIGQKRRDWNDQKKLEGWRESWATLTNAALERAGRPERIDHRTLEAQGIDRRPTIHTGRNPAKIAANNAIKEQNAKLEDIDKQLEELRADDGMTGRPIGELVKEYQSAMKYNDAIIKETTRERSEIIEANAQHEIDQIERDHREKMKEIEEEREEIAERIRTISDEEYEGYKPPRRGLLRRIDYEAIDAEVEELTTRDEELNRRAAAATKETEDKRSEIIARATERYDATHDDLKEIEAARERLSKQTDQFKQIENVIEKIREKEQREKEEREQREKEARMKAEEERRKNMTTEEMKKEISDYVTKKNAYIMEKVNALPMSQLSSRRDVSIRAGADFDKQHEEEAASIAAMRKVIKEREPKQPTKKTRSRDDFER